MSQFVRASHPVFGTLMIPASWLVAYPGVWTPLDPDDPGSGPDPLSIYVRDVDLLAQMAAVAVGNNAFSAAQRAAFVAAVNETGEPIPGFAGRIVFNADGDPLNIELVEVA